MSTQPSQHGFTVIEIIVASLILIALGAVFWTQKTNIETAQRDDIRKISINAMYYSLEEVYKKSNNSYPKTLNKQELPSVDEALFTDPNDIMIGKSGSDYRYEPTNCSNDSCKSYTLRADMENEADYIKRGAIEA